MLYAPTLLCPASFARCATMALFCLILLMEPTRARGDTKEATGLKLPTAASVRLDRHKHPEGISNLAFSPDGRFLVTADASLDGLLHVWDWTKRKLALTIKSSRVRGLGFVDETTLVHTEWTKPPMLLYHDVTTGEQKQALALDYVPQGLGVSPKTGRVAVGEIIRAAGKQAHLRLYEGAQVIWSTATGAPRVGTLVFTADGKHLLMASDSVLVGRDLVGKGRNAEFDAETGKRLRDLPGREVLACSEDGVLLAGWGKMGPSIWERISGRLRTKLPYVSRGGYTLSACFSRDGRFVFMGGMGGSVAVHDLKKGKLLRTVKVDRKSCDCMALSPDGGWLATGGQRRIRIWNLSKWLPRK